MNRWSRDPLVTLRLGTMVIGIVWLVAARELVDLASGLAAGALFAVATIVAWRDATRLGRPWRFSDEPPPALFLDLAAAAMWMVANAPNPRGVSFIAIFLATAVTAARLGERGLVAGGAAYLVGRGGEELARVARGAPTPPVQIVGDATLVAGVFLAIAIAVRAFRAERVRTERAVERAESLQRVAVELAAETELDAVLRTIARSALSVVDAEHAAISVRHGEHFVVAAAAGVGEAIVGVEAPVDVGLVGDVVRARRTLEVREYGDHPTALPALVALGIHPLTAVPIFVNGRFAAALVVGRLERRPFVAEELALLEGLAAHAAVAVRNARILDRARRLEALGAALAAEGDREQVAGRVAAEAIVAFDADLVTLVVLEGGRIRFLAAEGVAAPLRNVVSDDPGSVVRAVVARRSLVEIADYGRGDPLLRASTRGTPVESGLFALYGGLHAVLAAPIVVGDDVAAVLLIGTTDPFRTFDVVDRQDVQSFARSAGVALQEAAARRDRERRLARLRALNELGAEFALLSEPSAIVWRAWEAAATLVTRDAFYVCRYHGATQRLTFLFRADEGGPPDLEPLTVPLGAGPSSEAIRTGRPYLARDPEDAVQHGGERFGDEARRCASAVHVPLRVRGEVVGVLSAQSYARGAYDAEDVAALSSLANFVGTAFDNADRLAETRELYLASVRALAAAVDARDPYTRSHSARVAVLARAIGEELALPPDELRLVHLGALLHDIGKIGVPDAILNKAGPLTEEEWVMMRAHSAIGGSILAAVEPLRDLVPVVVAHHERWDGTGYPAGLGGDELPLAAGIVAVAGAFEVIVSKRSYKEARSVEFAESELARCRGTQFHPAAVGACLRVLARDRSEGGALLQRFATALREEVADVPGPGSLVRSYAATARTHGRQLAVLQRLAMQISAVLDLDDLADRLVRIVCETMGYENGWITLHDPPSGDLVVQAALGASIDYLGRHLTPGQGISWWVMEHALAQNVGDVRADPRFIGPADIRSSLIVPLRIGDQLIGVVGVESQRPDAFGREDEELLAAVSHQVAAAVRVAQLHRETATAAATDPLTRLPNRRLFFERLAAAVGEPAVLSLAILDVNGLKALNDEHGHAAGDAALVRIGEILAAGVRDGDVVARIGGDEFGIVFPGATLAAAERVTRRLAREVAGGHLAGGLALPTAAWGVVSAPAAGGSADALVEAADQAMYRHKHRSGRPRLA